jgi:hypothetical protein
MKELGKNIKDSLIIYLVLEQKYTQNSWSHSLRRRNRWKWLLREAKQAEGPVDDSVIKVKALEKENNLKLIC